MSHTAHDAAGGVPSARRYGLVAVVLLLLLASTLVLAGINLGVWNTPVALGIAATKAVLIAWFFMDLRDGLPLQRLAAVVALVWLSILLLGALDDVLTRGWLTTPGH